MLLPPNASVLTKLQFLDLLPQCSSEVYQIAGYPEYSKDPNQLDATQKKVLTDLAQKIVSSHHTNLPYTAFIVIGHADAAMRKPVRERPEFEQRVSEDRADAARNALLTEIMKLPGGTEVAKKLAYKTRGEGSRQRIFRPPPPLSQAQMEANRRVEFYVAQCLLPPEPQPDPNDNLESRVRRLLKLLETKKLPNAPEHRNKRAPCVLGKLLKAGVNDTFVDGRATSTNGVGRFPVISNEGRACFLCEWNGNYDTDANPLPETEFLKFTAHIIEIIKAGGFNPSQSDDQVLTILNLVLERIDMGINQVDLYIGKNSAYVNPITGYGYSGDAVRKRLQKMYRDHLNDDNNIYSCYK